MKTTIKKLSYLCMLFAGAAILGACCEEEKKQITEQKQEIEKLKSERDSCCKPVQQRQRDSEAILDVCSGGSPWTFPLASCKFSFSRASQSFEIKNCNTGVTCTIPMAVGPNNWLKIEISGSNMIFTNTTSLPSSVETRTATTTDATYPATLNIVKNTYKYDDVDYTNAVYKIIGTDNGRNLTYTISLPNGGPMVFGNLNEKPIFVQRNSFNTTYTFKQETPCSLDKKDHTSAKVLAQRLYGQECP